MSSDTAIIQTGMPPGGAVLVSLMQAKELDADVYCSENNLDGAFQEYADEVDIYEYGKYVPESVPLSSTLNTILIALFKNPDFLEGYETVITHKNPAEILGLRAKRKYDCKFIWYGHNVSEFIWGIWDDEKSRFNQDQVSPVVKIIYMCFGPFLRILDQKSYQEADQVFTNSKKTKQKFEEVIGEKEDLKVLYPPIRNFDDGKDKGYVLTIGKVSPMKNTLDSVKICADLNMDLILAGRVSDPNYKHKLERISDDANMQLEIRGEVDDSELRDLVADCSFGLIPSQNENFGLTVAEIVSAEKPCYTHSSNGVAEIMPEEWVYEDISEFFETELERPEIEEFEIAEFTENHFKVLKNYVG